MRRLLPAALLLAAACSRPPELKVYRAAKERASSSEAASVGLSWVVPKGWVTGPHERGRVAGYSVPGRGGRPCDVSVSSLPGASLGLLADLNRFRAGLGLPPLTKADLGGQSRTLGTPAGQVLLVYLKNGDQRLEAGLLSLHGDSWVFKMSGRQGPVAQAEPSFRRFLASLRAEKD